MDDEKILAHIFKFLDVESKLYASSTCKRWMEVFNNHPGLLEDVKFYYTEYCPEDFRILTRKFSRFLYIGLDIDAKAFNFLERFGPQMRSLDISECKIRKGMKRKLKKCKQLSELNVSDGDGLQLFPELPALKTLWIHLDEDTWERDMKHLQRITPLSLTHLIIFDYIEEEDESLPPVLEDFVYKRRLSLQSLELVGPIELDCDRLSKMEGLRLKHLKVHAFELLNCTIESFCRHQPGITILEIGNCHPRPTDPNRDESRAFGDVHVMAICSTLPQLEQLSLLGCSMVKESVGAIFQLKSLRKLELVQCKGIMATSLLKAVEGLKCQKLEFLNLSQTCIGRLTLSKLLTLVPNLREIHLSTRGSAGVLKGQWVKSPWLEDSLHYGENEGKRGTRFLRLPN